MIQCPKCKRIIMDSSHDGGVKIRTRMLLFDHEGHAEALCPSCKTKVNVPIQLSAPISQMEPRQVVNQ